MREGTYKREKVCQELDLRAEVDMREIESIHET